MAVTVYTPGVQVLLTKLIQRTAATDAAATRYTGSQRQVDLTPYLGQAGTIRTEKDLIQAAGGFSISFADATDPATQDTLYASIEPMDLIEIRASRRPFKYAGTKLPLIMRGYVSMVRRAEGVDAEGNPQRVVVVQGQDSGKLWLINYLYFMVAFLPTGHGGSAPYLSEFSLSAVTGISPTPVAVNYFMQQLVSLVVNPKIEIMNIVSGNLSTPAVLPFTVDASVPDGLVYPQQGTAFDQQPIWNLALSFADRPWNELFVQDQESGPVLVFRPAPYKDLDGNFIVGGAVDPGTVDLDIADVVNLDLMRSDARVANFYWVPPGNASLLSNGDVSFAALISGEPVETGYENDDPNLYGLRKMESPTNLLPTSMSDIPNMLPPSERAATVTSMMQWAQTRATLLRIMNHDNSVFEEGPAIVKGSEDLVPGKYVHLTRGALTADYYLERVAHTIAPLRTWTSSLVLGRGTGFLNRIKYTGSPSAAEGRRGPYTS